MKNAKLVTVQFVNIIREELSRLKPSNSTGTDIEAVSLKNIVQYTLVFIDSMASFLLNLKKN